MIELGRQSEGRRSTRYRGRSRCGGRSSSERRGREEGREAVLSRTLVVLLQLWMNAIRLGTGIVMIRRRCWVGARSEPLMSIVGKVDGSWTVGPIRGGRVGWRGHFDGRCRCLQEDEVMSAGLFREERKAKKRGGQCRGVRCSGCLEGEAGKVDEGVCASAR
jgi:hypothetical protein